MRLAAGQFRELTHADLRFARQIGCSGVTVNKPDLDSPAWVAFLGKQFSSAAGPRAPTLRWGALDLANLKAAVEGHGLALECIEGVPRNLLDRAMLGLPDARRLEAYDISNLAGTDIVASMTVFLDGKPSKKDYKRFRLEGFSDQDDYASMEQVLRRRLTHFAAGDAGFAERPSALLIDGGTEHANVAVRVLQEFSLDIPVFGMVKDGRYRTRALVTADGSGVDR